ncbi:FeoA family protein [Nafulsella turpanensis]|uniref:FeoA family protein n=1 Tax=Nafulsella turpanensis TaxID=1265690 RepID=UPI000361826C|nr:FeoA family protein [Nafulsella turpanensis]
MNIVKARGKGRSVADLELGEKGIIKQLRQNRWTIKLLEMGCLPGTEVSLRFKTTSGGPLCIDVCGHSLSLRTEEAQALSLVE